MEQERLRREREERDKRLWEAGAGEKIQGRRVARTEYREHEADIKVDRYNFRNVHSAQVTKLRNRKRPRGPRGQYFC